MQTKMNQVILALQNKNMTRFEKGIHILVMALAISLAVPYPLLSKEKKDPVEITSDRMRSEDGGLKIIFSGNVIGYWGDLKITSDILEVYNTQDKKETEEIVAIGNVFTSLREKTRRPEKTSFVSISKRNLNK